MCSLEKLLPPERLPWPPLLQHRACVTAKESNTFSLISEIFGPVLASVSLAISGQFCKPTEKKKFKNYPRTARKLFLAAYTSVSPLHHHLNIELV